MTAKEFREYAEEHFGWAKTARSAKERQTFLQMAQAWLEAADIMGGCEWNCANLFPAKRRASGP